jgi:hypothetical protein
LVHKANSSFTLRMARKAVPNGGHRTMTKLH